MNDRNFEISLSALALVSIAWMVLGSIFRVLPVGAVIAIGLVTLICGGAALLYVWGKTYMGRE